MYSSTSVGDYGSRGGLHCKAGQPVTPDSVVGANILDGSSSGAESRKAHQNMSLQSSISQSDLTSPQLLTIFKTESSEQYQVTPNYLHSSVLIPATKDSKDQGVSERCRRRTCEWMYDICDYFQLNREVVGIALHYVDRYFTITFEDASGQVPVTRRQFQLVALTGLYIAVKLHGEGRQENLAARQSLRSPSQPDAVGQPQPWNRLKFSLAICASISRNQFTSREIEDCERNMLHTLDWHVNPIVSSGSIIDSLLTYLPSTICDGGIDESVAIFVYDSAKYLAELSVSVPALNLVFKPSVIAYASILYALETTCVTAQTRQEYENVIQKVSSLHYATEKKNVDGAKKILQAICPNLRELFPPPSTILKSPSSVNGFS
mmetsp:Transcript_32827/g.55831  ORF Transcript_32827/g.55831 Transcript_32827/m.55831 type:complete len:377 (-) Transcript_32827:261-1391(-)|eukprot:CAMPEP_0183726136 /NCGR_PEP_ID=MMETSP0737-20130205/22501_1 /TAXON_ID=385413 /ORGANISM="Thalassiosira miniscula, Strain CCMP1093" /LENGTH=376 /DNA_ID=CAMNT_0025957377 /DNA_START=114 /DNA_END=1244 /DNA_ORIENTATION=-